MHQADEPYASHMYTRTEYDDLHVGEWRVVQSYCPRRHCYVTDYAAPIVAPTVDTAPDPDAALAYDPLFRADHAASAAHFAKRRAAREAIIVAYLQEHGDTQLSTIRELVGVGWEALRGLCSVSERLYIERRGTNAYVCMVGRD